eukprot:TRINITY_DN9791_c0_g1_i3.p1 TRINITY_DN9791_c0_g1~~TRINITY_DN9791_c0_g1_i3.p1  ORF type:complete len:195 (-),score=39.48 TRINITY_DN9791_c0_g1_i3:824-1408(-)
MRHVNSAQELVDTVLSAGDKLVVVNYFSPGCGACRALHPKICQLAETNPDVEFVKVNHEENKSMCYSLHIHVLPFFQFYRGAHGRLCSFSCTNGTIKKFKDALAKHNTPRCSLGPPVGFSEAELKALSENKSLSFVMPVSSTTPDSKKTVYATESDQKKKEDLHVVWRGETDGLPSVGGTQKKEDELVLVGAER